MSENVLHRLIDAATGRQNIGPHEADGLHDEVTPGYSAKPLSAEEQAQLEALQQKLAVLEAKQAEDKAAAEAAAVPAAEAAV